MNVGADEAERWDKKKRKKNPDLGFAGEATLSLSLYIYIYIFMYCELLNSNAYPLLI